MNARVSSALRQIVRDRASGRCEYCLIHEDDALLSHEPDHVIARKHGGESVERNLAWACFLCNRSKGSDVASVDPETGRVVPVFSPRTQEWAEHFRLDRGKTFGLTPEGRATAMLLRFNRPETIETRGRLAAAGRYPDPLA
jgi:hypothetical protein